MILDNNKGFRNIRFKHKLNWMKTEWDQTRFASLVQWFGHWAGVESGDEAGAGASA